MEVVKGREDFLVIESKKKFGAPALQHSVSFRLLVGCWKNNGDFFRNITNLRYYVSDVWVLIINVKIFTGL